MESLAKFRYVPSPISFRYRVAFRATANKSGRMQYHKVTPGMSKERISRTEFIEAFNSNEILGIRPLPLNNAAVIQLEFYI